MYKKITPGPPSKQALPMLLKTPAPITAAIPIKVRSFTPSTLFSWPWPSSKPASASAKILSIDFFRINAFAMLVLV
jgi:hypothetical protein